jgi:hypothetical protein
MSCWVVPSVAAELWGVPLNQVLEWVRGGQVAARMDEGFTVVDVAPNGPGCDRPDQHGPRPQTWRPVTPQEMAALLRDDPTVIPPPAPVPAAATSDQPAADEHHHDDETVDESSENLGDWRTARRRASFMRIGPAKTLRAAS